jgi:CheY-like chemotaxis protein
LTATLGEPPHPRQADREEDRGFATSRSCILVVDDDVSIRETLADVLDGVGFRTLQAPDAAQALVILRTTAAVDALVTDMTMPGADGITLIREARAFRPDLPAILLTGYAEEIGSISVIGGCDVHLMRKPVGCDRLIEQLELLVGKLAGE